MKWFGLIFVRFFPDRERRILKNVEGVTKRFGQEWCYGRHAGRDVPARCGPRRAGAGRHFQGPGRAAGRQDAHRLRSGPTDERTRQGAHLRRRLLENAPQRYQPTLHPVTIKTTPAFVLIKSIGKSEPEWMHIARTVLRARNYDTVRKNQVFHQTITHPPCRDNNTAPYGGTARYAPIRRLSSA